MLHVVEKSKYRRRLALAKIVLQEIHKRPATGLPDPDGFGNRRRNHGWIADRAQGHKEDLMPQRRPPARGTVPGPSRVLPEPPAPVSVTSRNRRIAQQLLDCLEFPLATNQWSTRDRQPMISPAI